MTKFRELNAYKKKAKSGVVKKNGGEKLDPLLSEGKRKGEAERRQEQ